MLFKAGVVVDGLQPIMLLAIQVADTAFSRLSLREPTCTSALDGQHMEGSLHYTGFAIDLRMNDVPRQARERIFNALRSRLGPLGFDVIWEGKDTPREHIHIEWDPKPRED